MFLTERPIVNYPDSTQTQRERRAGERAPKEDPLPQDFFIVSLDLGKAQDYSARTTARYTLGDESNPDFPVLFGEIKRYDLHTPYAEIVSDTIHHIHKISGVCQTDLIIDNGGVGAAVMEMFTGKLPMPSNVRQHLLAKIFPASIMPNANIETAVLHLINPVAINITAGKDAKINTQANIASPVFNVPKEDLVGAVQFFLQTERLKLSNTTIEKRLLDLAFNELKSFQYKRTARNNLIWEARDGEHDDIVLSIAMAAWWIYRQIIDLPMMWA